jgi:hypothetical protein
MPERIYRYEVPVDNQWHAVELHGDPIAVACRDDALVEFWAVHRDGALTLRRSFIVVGTGHPLPPGATRHVGTAVAPGGSSVRHLMERRP